MYVEQRQAAADPQTKPPDLGYESACRLLSSTTAIAVIFVTQPEMCYSFNVPRRVEGSVDFTQGSTQLSPLSTFSPSTPVWLILHKFADFFSIT